MKKARSSVRRSPLFAGGAQKQPAGEHTREAAARHRQSSAVSCASRSLRVHFGLGQVTRGGVARQNGADPASSNLAHQLVAPAFDALLYCSSGAQHRAAQWAELLARGKVAWRSGPHCQWTPCPPIVIVAHGFSVANKKVAACRRQNWPNETRASRLLRSGVTSCATT